MNIIVANQQHNLVTDLNIEIIKSVEGVYSAEEIADMFNNMFFNKLIIDLTAIKDYQNIDNLKQILVHIPADKIILFLPTTKEITSSAYLSNLISIGIYNFTTNIEGVEYLLKNPNSYKDVAHFQQLSNLSSKVNKSVEVGTKVFGIRNLTNHAGATSLIYMLKKELEETFGMIVYALEIDRQDFMIYNDPKMLSIEQRDLSSTLDKLTDADVILIDMNDTTADDLCGNVLYLLEPSTIMLNKLIRKDKNIFQTLRGARIILNKSLLSSKEIAELEYETKTKFFFNIPPLDDRKRNNILATFLSKIGINQKEEKDKTVSSNKIIGLFKK